MSLTESVTIALEGEQSALFQALDAEEQAIKEKRNAMVTAILAGKGLLADVRATPEAVLTVKGGVITLMVPTDG